MTKILVLFAHPMLEKSRVQHALVSTARTTANVTVHDLYEEYPDFDVDVRREQALLIQHDIVVLQHPFYWYSCPALMKQWIDLVLEHGWAYGRHGKALQGKKMVNVISLGGSDDAYKGSGLNRHTVREFLIPFEQTATLCRMEYLPPYVVHGTHKATEEDIRRHADAYALLLERLGAGRISQNDLHSSRYLNDILSTVSGGKG
jgi:glutathione-regulated potassium-efflux system ancillary protein KefG